MHPLDNVIWRALTTAQAQFAQSVNSARRFPPEVTSLAAFSDHAGDGYDSLASLVDGKEVAALFYEDPAGPPPGWTTVDAAPLLQMVHSDCKMTSPATEMIKLTAADVPEMVALADLTKPGPFARRTRELGTYLGIRREGRLAAMAGERLRVPGYTEISAVCTHPDFTGRGYGGALVIALIEQIRARGEVPFLHVRSENQRAIELYRRLGFIDRRLYHLLVVRKFAG